MCEMLCDAVIIVCGPGLVCLQSVSSSLMICVLVFPDDPIMIDGGGSAGGTGVIGGIGGGDSLDGAASGTGGAGGAVGIGGVGGAVGTGGVVGNMLGVSGGETGGLGEFLSGCVLSPVHFLDSLLWVFLLLLLLLVVVRICGRWGPVFC